MTSAAPGTGDSSSERQVRRFVLDRRPVGALDDETFRLDLAPAAELRKGEARIEIVYLSLDPAMRSWLDDRPSYVPAVAIGGVMRARGVGRVVESHSDDPVLRTGALVVGQLGWQEEVIVHEDVHDLQEIPPGTEQEVRGVLGLLGNAGLTAWIGVGIGDPRPGETFVVTAAAGAVGSAAGQIAAKRGARVVGIAGGPKKCAVLRDELGFDAAVDYKADDWLQQLEDATPDGVDVLFENVGGTVLEAVIDRLNLHSRIAVCGLVATYDDADGKTGPANFRQFVTKRIRAEGFILHDHLDELDDASRELRAWLRGGEIVMLETVVDGFENLPSALQGLFGGANLGKFTVKVGDLS